CLLSDLCRFVIQSPKNSTTNLSKIILRSLPKSITNGSKAVQHNSFVLSLFLEGIQNTIENLFFQSIIYFCCSHKNDNIIDGFHNHLSVLLIFIFQIVHNSLNNTYSSDFLSYFNSCVY